MTNRYWLRLLPAAMVLLVLGLGTWGWHRTCHVPASATDSLYKAIQLFGLNFDPPCGPITPALQLARLLAPAIGVVLLALGLSERLRTYSRLIVRLARGRRKTVVVGFGRCGQAIAELLVDAHPDRPVLAVDRSATSGEMRRAEAAGIELHELDADDHGPIMGFPIRLHAGDDVIVALATDADTLTVGAALRERLARRSRRRGEPPPNSIWMQLRSGRLVDALLEVNDVLGAAPPPGTPTLRPFQLVDGMVHRLMHLHPPPLRALAAGHKRVHVMLHGFGGEFSWRAAEQIVLVGMMPAPNLAQPLLTILADDPAAAERAWRKRHPTLASVATIAFLQNDVEPPAPNEPVNLHLFCHEDDQRSLAAALQLRQAMIRGALPPAAIAAETASRWADIAETQGRPQQAFLLVGDAPTAARYLPVVNPWLDRFAASIHAVYAGVAAGPNKDDAVTAAWLALPMTMRASNLRVASHTAQKLALLGFEAADAGKPWFGLDADGLRQIWSLDEPAREALDVLEHSRWRADRMIDGWTAGPRDDERRTRDQLAVDVSAYASLNDAERRKDRAWLDALRRMAVQRAPPASGGVRRVIEHVYEGAPPHWSATPLALSWPDLSALAGVVGDPATDHRLRLLIPPEPPLAFGETRNERRQALRSAFARLGDAARAALHAPGLRIRFERAEAQDWSWLDPDPLVDGVALPPLTIGFVGHRDPARLGDAAQLRAVLAGELERLRPTRPGATLRLVTGAADGADALMLDVWRELALGPVTLLFPYGDADRPRTDADPATLAPEALLASADERLIAAAVEPGWPPHVAVGRAICARATLLFAVLDDEPGDAMPGGTKAVVADARARGMMIRRLRPKAAE